MTPPRADRLQHRQSRLAAEVLTRAFLSEPFCEYAFPDEQERQEGLLSMFAGSVSTGFRFGEVYATPPNVSGVSIWIAPGRFSEIRPPAVAGPERQDPDARLSRVIHALSELHHRHVPEPHWYLMVIGVDPDRQRQGIGTALIDPVLRRADSGGLPCFLETSKESNISFYERRGFRVVEHVTVDGLLDSWGMVRDPG